MSPIPKPTKKRKRVCYDNLAIPKPQRVINDDGERSPYCMRCGFWGYIERHHIKSRGSGGDDSPENIIDLCDGPTTNDCHGEAHNGHIPKSELYAIKRRIIEQTALQVGVI